ncbi:hypothetical protein [Jatrophihabitans lederbergiae]|uniref:Acetone carboxylase subunit gamma n=1 Tax=Jatrophihabitans lederbergiae TaxID=3075547 RepID=A0ABU2JC43_9ACTN|nr:hypothetical protein [Jatrophihabitans sp. DSM 44399]MDT0262326.1 hypothetical protein [Jatrophihabitans sp. DSM 44399]
MTKLPNSRSRPNRGASDEFVHPNLEQRTLWSVRCTHCDLSSYHGNIPRFTSTKQLWTAMLARGWTRRDDGRVLCLLHTRVADCQELGHAMTDWTPHVVDPTALQWRYCQRCGANFAQRVRSDG